MPAQAGDFTFSEASAALQAQARDQKAPCQDIEMTDWTVSSESQEEIVMMTATEPAHITGCTGTADSIAMLQSGSGSVRRNRGSLAGHQAEHLMRPEEKTSKSGEDTVPFNSAGSAGSDHTTRQVSRRSRSRIQNQGGDRSHGQIFQTSQVIGVKRDWASISRATFNDDPELVAVYQEIEAECEDSGFAE